LGAAPVCSWVFSGCGFRLNFSLALAWRWNTLYLLIHFTVDKFSAITSCGDSGSFLLHPAAFNPLRALSQFSLTPSNSHTSAFSRLHLLSFDIQAQNTPRGCIARPSQLAGHNQLTPWFPVHTQKRGYGLSYFNVLVRYVGAPTFPSLPLPISIFNFPFSQSPVCSPSPFRVHWNYRFP